MKIGLFGGTFNPPHLGHTKIASTFYKASGVDLLVVMPAFISPNKKQFQIEEIHRLEMTKIAFLKLGEMGINYTVSDYEIKKQGVSYTIDSVYALEALYNTKDISMCIGSDMLYSFEKWKSFDILLNKCHIFTMAREYEETDKLMCECERLKNIYNARITLIDNSVFPSSSTDIRAGVKESITKLDDNVRVYIEKHGLYK